MNTKEITPLTNQQVFDNALNGVRAQGYVRSQSLSGSCSYRGDGTLKCGIGHSIPDEVYVPSMDCLENSAINEVVRRFSDIYGLFKDCDKRMLNNIQQAHDIMDKPSQFEDAMRTVAIEFDLKYTKP